MKHYYIPLLSVFLWMSYVNPHYGYRNPTARYTGAFQNQYDYLEHRVYRQNRYQWSPPTHTRLPDLVEVSQNCHVTKRSERTLRKGLTARFATVCSPRYQFRYPKNDYLYYSDPSYLSSPIYR